ncbi:MbtH family protein [Ancylobacter sp. Lp-2]|uniref:MbtH family protein n=1 Tax=Ancylobacter sp. Lp-2 TaxID=2881339 RepID=UPI001E29C136|nr:MbtH family protein [Ancylobacter sp. Lp-2]MCB4769623.1 MbtH family protein [Ancylobacter sp. Lp-2]
MDDHHLNPFDDERHLFLALVNADGQYSLWPSFRDVPEGWRSVHGPDDRASCLQLIEREWQDISPAARRISA